MEEEPQVFLADDVKTGVICSLLSPTHTLNSTKLPLTRPEGSLQLGLWKIEIMRPEKLSVAFKELQKRGKNMLCISPITFLILLIRFFFCFTFKYFCVYQRVGACMSVEVRGQLTAVGSLLCGS